jgi:hypothetical protein
MSVSDCDTPVGVQDEVTDVTSSYLQAIDVLTGDVVNVTTGSVTQTASEPAYSPDGSVILFLGDDPNSIYQVRHA